MASQSRVDLQLGSILLIAFPVYLRQTLSES